MKNLANILMAAGALAVLAAGIFAAWPVHVAGVSGICALGAGYYFKRFHS